MTSGAKRSAWKWTPQKERAALLLAEGATWAELDNKHSIAHSALAVWVKAPEFQARIDEHHTEIVAEAQRILRRNTGRAAQMLVHLMTSGNQMHSVKLKAAQDILDRVGLKSADKIESKQDLKIIVDYVDATKDTYE